MWYVLLAIEQFAKSVNRESSSIAFPSSSSSVSFCLNNEEREREGE